MGIDIYIYVIYNIREINHKYRFTDVRIMRVSLMLKYSNLFQLAVSNWALGHFSVIHLAVL